MRFLVNKFLPWQFFDALLFLSKSLLIYVGIFLFFSLNMEKYKIHFFRKLMPAQDTTKSKLTLKKICSFLCSSLVQILFFFLKHFSRGGHTKKSPKESHWSLLFCWPVFWVPFVLDQYPIGCLLPKSPLLIGSFIFLFSKKFQNFLSLDSHAQIFDFVLIQA